MALYKLCSILLLLCAYAACQEEIDDFDAVEVYKTVVKIQWNETEKLATYVVTDMNRNISRTTNKTAMTWYDLEPGTQYKFNVMISMINNTAPTLNYSSEYPLNGTTNNATFMTISNLTSMDVTMDSSKLLWEPMAGVKSYTLLYRAKGESMYMEMVSDLNMVVLKSLMPNTTYEALVLAQTNSTDDDDVRGYESMKHMFLTEMKIMPDMNNTNTTMMNSTTTTAAPKNNTLDVKHKTGKKSFEIFWTTKENVTSFIVFYTEKGTTDKMNKTVVGDKNDYKVHLTNLKTNTEYFIQLAVEKLVGNKTVLFIESEQTLKTAKVISRPSSASRDLATSFSVILALAFARLFF